MITGFQVPGKLALVVWAAIALSGCAQTSRVTSGAEAGRSSKITSPRSAHLPSHGQARPSSKARVDLAVEQLRSGNAAAAAVELRAVLAERPRNSVARKLLDQIDKDPVVLLGARSYPYQVRAGDSVSELAGRFLGDPLLFYALARYNGLRSPESLSAGQVLRIPGTPKAKPTRPTAPTVVAGPTRDPARANKLRADALDQLNGGTIEQAISLLRQAQQLDPGSEAIRRDLDRATRLHAAIRPS